MSLEPADIYRICEWGHDKHALDRALVLLRASQPDADPADLVRLPIGRRDGLLLGLRGSLFGERFDMRARCPECEATVEFSMTLGQLLQSAPDEGGEGRVELADGLVLACRLPDSLDLAAVATIDDAGRARRALLGRCIRATRDGEPVHLSDVPSEALDAAVATLAERDPQSDITFKLTCGVCGHRWRTLFDVLSYLWAELEAYATRLQDDIHALALAYGWSESEVLRLSPARRRRYVELIGSG